MKVDRELVETYFKVKDEVSTAGGRSTFTLTDIGDDRVHIQPERGNGTRLFYDRLSAILNEWHKIDLRSVEKSVRPVLAARGLKDEQNESYLVGFVKALRQCEAVARKRQRISEGDAPSFADLRQWVEDRRHECGLVYVKRGPEGAPLNFTVAGKAATTGLWSIALKRQPIHWYLIYHRIHKDEGDVWIGKHKSTAASGDRFEMTLSHLQGPVRVYSSFRALTGVKESQRGIRYADKTETEAASASANRLAIPVLGYGVRNSGLAGSSTHTAAQRPTELQNIKRPVATSRHTYSV